METTIEITFTPRNKAIEPIKLFDTYLRRGMDMDRIIDQEILDWVKINYITSWDIKD